MSRREWLLHLTNLLIIKIPRCLNFTILWFINNHNYEPCVWWSLSTFKTWYIGFYNSGWILTVLAIVCVAWGLDFLPLFLMTLFYNISICQLLANYAVFPQSVWWFFHLLCICFGNISGMTTWLNRFCCLQCTAFYFCHSVSQTHFYCLHLLRWNDQSLWTYFLNSSFVVLSAIYFCILDAHVTA